MEIHDLIQGSDEWAAFRLAHHGASEAAAMLGLSKKTTRNELLRIKHTGTPKEFSDWVQKSILDHGHEVEAMARPLIEAILGEDLYPATCSDGKLSASCDGLTMLGDTAFEHKQWNEELAASVRAGALPEEHMPQCQQIMMVSGARRVIFVVSDGTPDRMVSTEVLPDDAWFARIRAGWAQFDRDLADYELPAAAPMVAAAPQEHLPAVSVQVSGTLAVVSNLEPFGKALRAFVERIPKQPGTDQEFADTEAACKRLKEVEERLAAAEDSALGSMADVEAMRRMVANLRELARQTRLAGEKAVKTRKEAIRAELIEAARRKFVAHTKSLQDEIKGVRLAITAPPFGEAIKGLKTLASIQNALDTGLANAKIEANALAADVRGKLNWFEDNVELEYRGLFRDLDDLVTVAPEYFQQTVVSRVDQHRKTEEARFEAERHRIRVEEEIRARAAAESPFPVTQQAELAPAAPTPSVSTIAAPASSSRPMEVQQAAPTSAPTLRLGQINERLSPISLTAEGLASLGFRHSATDKAAKLYHESQFPQICAALVRHIQAMQRAQSTPALLATLTTPTPTRTDMAKTDTAPAPYVDEPYVAIPMRPVTSKQVKAIGYDESTQTLAVSFTRGTGAVYHYPGVTPELHANFMAAESIGSFFGQHIKDRPFKKYRAPDELVDAEFKAA